MILFNRVSKSLFLNKGFCIFLFTLNQIGNQWTVMPWTVLIWIAGLKQCCFLYMWSKNLPKIKDAVDSRGDVHLPCLFYGALKILTNICPWFFNSVAVLDLKMMQEKALNFYFCHATDSAFCTELLATFTIYYCLTLRSAVAPLKRNSEEDNLDIMINGITINGITIKYLNTNDEFYQTRLSGII